MDSSGRQRRARTCGGERSSTAGVLTIVLAIGGSLTSLAGGTVYAGQGSWSPTASLPEPRAGQSAVLLLDGEVLLAGPDAATLLYDPAAETWTRTGNNNSGARRLTRLTDGRVLGVAEGAGIELPDGAEQTSELFDPSTGIWTRTGDMSHGRNGHTATLLQDGRVLVAGGAYCDLFGCVQPPPPWYVSAEIFDPSTGTWAPTSPMVRFRTGHTATLLADGRVLLAGGVPGFVPSAEIFDPSIGSWTETAPMLDSSPGTATLLGDGTVLMVSSSIAELYYPATDTWSLTATPNDSRTAHTATLLGSGHVLVAGGFVACPADLTTTPQLNSSEEYDSVTGTWGARTFLTTGRYGHTATLLNDGRVLIAGGVAQIFADPDAEGCFDATITDSAEIYTAASIQTGSPVLRSMRSR